MQHTLLTCDCLSHLKTIENQSIDAVITSPPYNIGIQYSGYDDRKPRDLYIEWLTDIGKEIARVMRPHGSFFLNMGSTNIDPWIGMDVVNSLRDMFVLQNHIIWVKSISIEDDTVGHFKPISSKRFLNNNHENIFHLTLNGHVPIDRISIGVQFKYKSNIKRRNHIQDKRCAGNVWFIPYETIKSKTQKYNHPAIFPIALPEKCLKMTGLETGIVLDPFSGIGTTSMAAKKIGWDSIGLDIDPVYTEMAKQRLGI